MSDPVAPWKVFLAKVWCSTIGRREAQRLMRQASRVPWTDAARWDK